MVKCPQCAKDDIDSELIIVKSRVGDPSYDTGPGKKDKRQRVDVCLYCLRCHYEEGRSGRPPV